MSTEKTDKSSTLDQSYKPKDQVETVLDPKAIDDKLLDRLPNPTGYRLLILPYAGPKKTKGGIALAEKTLETIEMTKVVGLVVKMGDLCYQDETKFPNGPWCKEGQVIIYGRYAGARFKTKFGEHRIINDDEIIGTIEKPEDVLALF